MSENNKASGFSHEKIETSNFLMIVLIVLVIAFGGLAEIVPLFFQKSTTEPVQGLKPYTALQLAGRQLVGGVMAGHDGRRGYLNHLLVHRQLRGQGIARALVEHAIAALDAAGISKSHIDVERDNARGQGFWAAQGWTRRDDLFRFSLVHSGSANA